MKTKKEIKKMLALFLCISLLLCVWSLDGVLAQDNAAGMEEEDYSSEAIARRIAEALAKTDLNEYAEKYDILWERNVETGKYDYPIDNTSPLWGQLTHADRTMVCYIPDYVLEDITDTELVELVLGYPLLIDVYAYNTFQDGITIVSAYFPELAVVVENLMIDRGLEDYAAEQSLENISMSEEVFADADSKHSDGFLDMFMNDLLIYEHGVSCEQEAMAASYVYVTTPNGTAVPCKVRGEELSAAEKERLKNEWTGRYPQATFISEATTNYNCHSYAFYSASTSNIVWMDDCTEYLTDGSYQYVGNSATANNQRVYYNTNHSGIVVNASSGVVISKWGSAPLMQHQYWECPYFNPGTICSFYTR